MFLAASKAISRIEILKVLVQMLDRPAACFKATHVAVAITSTGSSPSMDFSAFRRTSAKPFAAPSGRKTMSTGPNLVIRCRLAYCAQFSTGRRGNQVAPSSTEYKPASSSSNESARRSRFFLSWEGVTSMSTVAGTGRSCSCAATDYDIADTMLVEDPHRCLWIEASHGLSCSRRGHARSRCGRQPGLLGASPPPFCGTRHVCPVRRGACELRTRQRRGLGRAYPLKENVALIRRLT
jgi:hypothetical protein